MNRPDSAILIAAACSAALLTGCQTPPPPAVEADYVTNYPRVTATGGVNTVLLVRETGVVVDNSDVLRVQVPVRNVASETKLAQYRFFFFDENGTVHNDNPAWKRARIAPNVEVFMSANSIRPAADFRLEIRPQR
jgi:uncharacterized protein YcfL